MCTISDERLPYWSQEKFYMLDLADKRLTRRLRDIAAIVSAF